MKAPVNRYAILTLSAALLGTTAAHAQSSVTLASSTIRSRT